MNLKRSIGGQEVGAVGLGCMGMTWAYGVGDEDESIRVVHRAIELGVTFLDTADMYGPHTNEELLGRALAGRRDEVVLATKAGIVVRDKQTFDLGRDGTPDHLRAAIDGSLERLRTDHVDLWYLHRVDPDVPVEESVGAMAEAVAAGKTRGIGLSEVDVPTLERAHAVHPLTAVQSELSLWTRDPIENGVLEWCRAHGVAFVPYSPLGRGFLTGRITSTDDLNADGDFRATTPRFAEEALQANLKLAEQVRTIAARKGAQASQVAIAWTLAQGEHVVPIPGTKRVRWLEENAGAADVQLDAADLAELDPLASQVVGGRYAS